MQLASTNTDQPTVDEPTSSPAGLSSPPARRRKRQEDLIPSTIPDDFALGQPIRPARNATRVDLSPRDVLDDQTGTFPADPADEREEGEEEDAAEPYQTYNYRALQDEMYSGPTDFALHSRSYDDEDAALQAALKASMDDLPPDWVAPEVEAKEKVTKKPTPAPPPLLTTKPVAAPPVTSPGAAGSNFKEEIEAEDEDVQTEPLSAGTTGFSYWSRES